MLVTVKYVCDVCHGSIRYAAKAKEKGEARVKVSLSCTIQLISRLKSIILLGR